MNTQESKNREAQEVSGHIQYLRELLEDYIDEIPDQIILTSPSNYKVRGAWLTGVSTALEKLFLDGLISDDALKNDYEAWYESLQNRERKTINGEEHFITTRENIDVANDLLRRAIENLQNGN